jgi:hypothetical protein
MNGSGGEEEAPQSADCDPPRIPHPNPQHSGVSQPSRAMLKIKTDNIKLNFPIIS